MVPGLDMMNSRLSLFYYGYPFVTVWLGDCYIILFLVIPPRLYLGVELEWFLLSVAPVLPYGLTAATTLDALLYPSFPRF